ncbi:amidohydrolase [Jonesiaceae bacterium BS-20]|uniref:Amidohydrolase n=1 Tax=Jonesiaceae bacterium BS-20 TaxID=3120821 RepID=A0AAU7DVD2_9MICO
MAIDLESLYVDLHKHPELSFQEHRTAAIVAEHLENLGYEVQTGIGQTGVVGVLENGDGPAVLLRADMDGLPVLEATGLAYASTERAIDHEGNDVPVMHACGHDVHVTALIGAAEQLAESTEQWSGTVIALFQPAEERGGGAQAMVDDGLFDSIPAPAVVLGQHVGPFPAGVLALQSGVAMAAADSLRINLYGRGGHGSRPEAAIDPVLMAANLTVRLQQIVSREVASTDSAVVTVGQLRAGTKSNIIPDDATLGLSVRSFNPEVREQVLGAIERMAQAEAAAAGAERAPEVILEESFPLTVNNPDATARTAQALASIAGPYGVVSPGPMAGSEDVSVLSTASSVPLVYWFLGGLDHDLFGDLTRGAVDTSVPANHSPLFAPVLQPTLSVGVAALLAAAREWLD